MEINYKNALILGAGISGKGSAYALNKLGCKTTIVESDSVPDCAIKADIIITSPSIKPSHEIYKFACLRDIPIVSEIGLGAMINNMKVIGVTGTNGKTTVVSMIGEILTNAGIRNAVCGNIGVSFAEVAVNGGYDVVVLELSSFQLLYSFPLHVNMACILNIAEDHLDYHGSFLSYKRAKFNITNRQTNDDYLIVPKGNDFIIHTEAARQDVVPVEYPLKIIGEHNKINAGFAATVARNLGVSEDVIKNTLMEFAANKYRIELVAERNGVKFYNDSKGTNISATITACKALGGDISLIVGGSDKNLCYSLLFKDLPQSVRAVYVTGDNADLIISAGEECGYANIYKLESLKQAVMLAAESGSHNVLFSPACASFDRYSDYRVRGKAFDDLVKGMAVYER